MPLEEALACRGHIPGSSRYDPQVAGLSKNGVLAPQHLQQLNIYCMWKFRRTQAGETLYSETRRIESLVTSQSLFCSSPDSLKSYSRTLKPLIYAQTEWHSEPVAASVVLREVQVPRSDNSIASDLHKQLS
jgi:hypothetical protein